MNRRQRSKRKRLESTQSQASGISTLSYMSRSADDLNDGDDTISESSKYHCNGILTGSRSDAINVVQPQINFDTLHLENKRQRRVSWGLSDGEEETVPKEINSPSISPLHNNYDVKNRSPNADEYTRVNATTVGRSTAPQLPVITGTMSDSQRNELVLRRQIAEQQRTIAHLLERDRIHTQKLLQRQKFQARRSISVTSLRESPKNCAAAIDRNGIPENRLYESVHHGSKTNIPIEANARILNENIFVFPPKDCNDRRAQQRSRSCDFLSAGEENETLLSPQNRNVPFLGSSSGYEHVTDQVSNTSVNESEPKQDDVASNHRYCDNYNLRKWFYLLLVFNMVIVLLNLTGIPFVHKALNRPTEKTCIKCELLSTEYRETFLKEEDKCCLKSTHHLMELFANVTQRLESRLSATKALRSKRSYNDAVPIVQYRARGRKIIDNISRIAWGKESEYPIQRAFGQLDPDSYDTSLSIPVSGLYYIFTRVHFRKRFSAKEDIVTFGHSIMKLNGTKSNWKMIDTVVENCFPTSGIIQHASHLNFVHNFTKSDRVYVKLNNGKYFDTENSVFGLFLIQKL